ncbi:transcriptional regulator [Sphaerisporangium rufum]|uniref:Transcriptional regulator n=1 Tax=Sphaerisporangium rufum TaxID=1381558 RepID=A0A919R052_9ACTN|nr:helix-turn-helix transcriptional regulator [Sphaerisporangium rufum]GII77224.1 transcriptional regulator [Sphaerisporangium rufum]
MSEERESETDSARQRFGAELRRMRETAGLSQSSIAARLRVTQTHISRLELGKRTPHLSQATILDEIFQLTEKKYFVRLCELSKEYPLGPDWYLRWAEEIEPAALVLRSWDPLLVPGLLQTEAYARLIFTGAANATPEETEARVRARLQRQSLLDQEKPPAIWALIDTWVLNRLIGGPAVMCQQLDHLLETSIRYNVHIQLVPGETVPSAGLSSGFALAQLPDGTAVVSIESAGRGEISTDQQLITHVWGAYDKIRAEALPLARSVEMIKEARDKWSSR